jgi:uncharacterized protein
VVGAWRLRSPRVLGEKPLAHSIRLAALMERSPERDDGERAAVRQYSLPQVVSVWAAAAVPMGVLAWLVAPWLKKQLGPEEPLAPALLICITAGLIWQFVLVLVLVRRELGGLPWARVRKALWLQAPRGPNTGRVGGRIWWWALLLVVLYALWQLAPALPAPSSRDFGHFLGSAGGREFLSGAWGWFALIVVLALFNTALGEELLFRGFPLPRMHGVFGRGDWVANGALFAVYHLHVPWAIPSSLVDGLVLLAYPSRRLQSAWMGIIVHSAQSVFFVGLTSRSFSLSGRPTSTAGRGGGLTSWKSARPR